MLFINYVKGDRMLRLKTALFCIFFSFTALFVSCISSESTIPSNEIQNIRVRIGYVLAPSYLPKGYTYIPGNENSDPFGTILSTSRVQLSYREEGSKEKTTYLIMSYPVIASISSFEEQIGLEVPKDAITEMEINGGVAYLFHGSWSDETLKRIIRGEDPINPKWDYGSGKSIRFTINVPDEGKIWINLKAIIPVEQMTDEEIIKIAKSVMLIE